MTKNIQTHIYQTSQIREIERLAQEKYQTSGTMMMQRAGQAALDFLLKKFPHAQSIAIFCGNGNNGGDGYVLAKLAQQKGIKVHIWQVKEEAKKQSEAQQALESAQASAISMAVLTEEAELKPVDVVVDAIAGIGLRGQLREPILMAIHKMEQMAAPILAIDVPTGIDADTGGLLGKAVRANATITFIGLKVGLLTGPGIAYTGELLVNDLDLPSSLFREVAPVAEKITLETYAHYLKPRPRDWHKGLSGHVLVVGGNMGYSGAPHMAALAALRVGAGLVTIATHPENAAMMNVGNPELMCQGIRAAEDLKPLLEKANVVIVGPGLGQGSWAQDLWQMVYQSKPPLVVDADGLNLLAQTPKIRENWLLTPHPGEAARLLQCEVSQLQQNRLVSAQQIVQAYQSICVLKGAGTIVAAQKDLPGICDKGNPGMATAGMGDVLSGVIGGLIAQGIPLIDAAKLGVYLHALAGDLAAKDEERGLIATDLMPYLRQVSNIRFTQ